MITRRSTVILRGPQFLQGRQPTLALCIALVSCAEHSADEADSPGFAGGVGQAMVSGELDGTVLEADAARFAQNGATGAGGLGLNYRIFTFVPSVSINIRAQEGACGVDPSGPPELTLVLGPGLGEKAPSAVLPGGR